MIELLTLLIGLTVGPHTIEAMVDPTPAAVVFWVDGERQVRVTEPPWRARVDFGRELRPHHLLVVAHDDSGAEIARAEQWVNLPRSGSELRISLWPDEGRDPGRAQLTWESVSGRPPTSLELTFDGAPMAGSAEGVARLPDYDPDQIHFLVASATFDDGSRARAETVFGGLHGKEVSTDLTAVAVRLDPGTAEPTPESLAGALTHRGRALEVVAVERGPAEVIVVRDRRLEPVLQNLRVEGGRRPSMRRFGPRHVSDPDGLRFDMRTEPEDRVRFLWPTVDRSRHPRFDQVAIFDLSPVLKPSDGGFYWFLTRLYPAAGPADSSMPQHLSDALAVAGRRVAAGDRRRAVVLALGPAKPPSLDEGNVFTLAQARSYLRSLGVPLRVWRAKVAKKNRTRGPLERGESVVTVSKLRSAVEALYADLASQRIVWVRGRYLPQELTTTGLPPGVSPLAERELP